MNYNLCGFNMNNPIIYKNWSQKKNKLGMLGSAHFKFKLNY